MIPTNKQDAIKLGLKTFNTGKPCKFGHFSDRRTQGGMCIECQHPLKNRPVAPEGSNVLHGIAFPLGTPEDTMRLVMRWVQDNVVPLILQVDTRADPRSKDVRDIKMIGCGLSWHPQQHRCFKVGLVNGLSIWFPVYLDELLKDSLLNPAAAQAEMGIFTQTVYDKQNMARDVWMAATFDVQHQAFLTTPVYLWKHDMQMAQTGMIGPRRDSHT